MGDFNTLFPNFLDQCAELNRVLTPVAIVLFVVGIVSSTVTGHRSPSAYLRTIARTGVYVAVLASLLTWGTEVATAIDDTVKNTLQANPKQVHADYQKALTMQKGAADNKSWWDLLDAQAIFEAVLSTILVLFGWLAGVIIFYAYLAQKFILYIAYGFAPLFIGFLAVRSLHSIGVSYLLGFVGVLCWPLGWGAASIMTRGLLDFMADQSLLSLGVAGAAGYALQNLLGIAALALWLIFSTIAAPIIIQKAIATGTQIGQALAGGAVTAGIAGASSGAGAAAAVASGGGFTAGVAGLIAGGAVATVAAAESSTSGSTYSPLGNLLGSLASQRSAQRAPNKPRKDDPAGDEAVREILRRHRN